jgi:predicted nucleic acid-binding protein
LRRSITLDTGALIALERRGQRITNILHAARLRREAVIAPAPVVTEWWRGRTDWRETILASMNVEPMDEWLAKLAGEAIAEVQGATAIDAIVMASAARRGEVVYTSDVRDLERLRLVFPNVRVLSV